MGAGPDKFRRCQRSGRVELELAGAREALRAWRRRWQERYVDSLPVPLSRLQHFDMVVSALSSALLTQTPLKHRGLAGLCPGARRDLPPAREAASSMPRQVPFCSDPLQWRE